MTEETKEAVRLLIECMHELRAHDEDYDYMTSRVLRKKLLEYLERNGIDSPEKAAELLGLPEE